MESISQVFRPGREANVIANWEKYHSKMDPKRSIKKPKAPLRFRLKNWGVNL
jgi:hypothetical protein